MKTRIVAFKVLLGLFFLFIILVFIACWPKPSPVSMGNEPQIIDVIANGQSVKHGQSINCGEGKKIEVRFQVLNPGLMGRVDINPAVGNWTGEKTFYLDASIPTKNYQGEGVTPPALVDRQDGTRKKGSCEKDLIEVLWSPPGERPRTLFRADVWVYSPEIEEARAFVSQKRDKVVKYGKSEETVTMALKVIASAEKALAEGEPELAKELAEQATEVSDIRIKTEVTRGAPWVLVGVMVVVGFGLACLLAWLGLPPLSQLYQQPRQQKWYK